jgi:hypothetical protein
VRIELVGQVLLDRHEVKDLIHRNLSLNADTYAEICRSLSTAFPLGRAPYREFSDHVQGYLEPPLKLEHFLDRVILTRAAEDEDVRLLMTLLALSMETDTYEDRARSFFLMFSAGEGSNKEKIATNGVSTIRKLLSKNEVADSIDYLHAIQQIPVEQKFIKTDREYPVQSYVELSVCFCVVAATEAAVTSPLTLKAATFIAASLNNRRALLTCWGNSNSN